VYYNECDCICPKSLSHCRKWKESRYRCFIFGASTVGVNNKIDKTTFFNVKKLIFFFYNIHVCVTLMCAKFTIKCCLVIRIRDKTWFFTTTNALKTIPHRRNMDIDIHTPSKKVVISNHILHSIVVSLHIRSSRTPSTYNQLKA
jgi:hypothetical protein